MNVNRWRRTFWLFAGVTLVGLAGWQIAQISVGQYGLLNPPKPLQQPTKVRSDGRVPLPTEIVSSDPVGTYLERSKRGMTDREIGWMVDDFQALWLDNPPLEASKELHRIFRAKQHSWYSSALREGLSLSMEQRVSLEASLQERLVADFDNLIIPSFRAVAKRPWEQTDRTLTRSDELTSLEWNQSLASAPRWLSSTAAYAPWNLCVLNEAQEKLTLKAWIPPDPPADFDPIYTPASPPSSWVSEYESAGVTIQDPITGNQLEAPLIITEARPEFISLRGTGVLPLTLDQQVIYDRLSDPLAQARLCQPAQLRIALLFDPTLAELLAQQLSSPGTSRMVPKSLVYDFADYGTPLIPEVVTEPPTQTEPPVVTEPELPSE